MTHEVPIHDVHITRHMDIRDRLLIQLYKPTADRRLHENEIPLGSLLIPAPLLAEYGKPSDYWVRTDDPASLNLGADVGYALNRLTDLIAEVE